MQGSALKVRGVGFGVMDGEGPVMASALVLEHSIGF